MSRVRWLGALALLLTLGPVPSAWAGLATPSGGTCPQPPNALVISEFMTGPLAGPHWVEVTNPGKYALSIDKVNLTILPGDGKGPPLTFNLGQQLPEIKAGEAWAFGDVPQGALGDPYKALKYKVIELGKGFVMPLCKGKILLEGPGGPIDTMVYDVCPKGLEPDEPVAWGLDPALVDQCKNDTLATWCLAVGDLAALGTPEGANTPCDLDGDGFSSAIGDCNDVDKAIFPGAVEVCNGIDDDCNGLTDDNVLAPLGTCLSEGVCAGPAGDGLLKDGTPVANCAGSDGFVCTYPFGYESVTETLCDGFDNDCDGKTDEGLLNACGTCGPVPKEICNGLDDNCDGQTDELAALEGFSCGTTGVCLGAAAACGPAGAPVCSQPAAWQSDETLCDGLDNDCDGMTDEDLGLGGNCSTGVGACAAPGVRLCGPAGEVTCSGVAATAGVELCGDGLDNNCDGKTDEGFGTGEQCEAGLGICRVVGKRVCSEDHTQSACNVKPAPADSVERCGNGLDDNCNGQTDEAGCTSAVASKGCAASSGPPGRALWSLLSMVALFIVVWKGWRNRH